MKRFDSIVVEFELSSAEAAQICHVVAALGMDLRDPRVAESVRSALRECGVAAFAGDFRSELWGVRVFYDPETTSMDTDRATMALRREFGIEGVEWVQMLGCGDTLVEFGFRCPESWVGVLPVALGGAIRRRLLSIVRESKTYRRRT